MKDDKDEWIEGILGSIKGIQKATPPPDLLSKIEQAIYMNDVKIIPLNTLRLVAASISIFLIAMNGYAISVYSAQGSENIDTSEQAYSNLISDYKLYE